MYCFDCSSLLIMRLLSGKIMKNTVYLFLLFVLFLPFAHLSAETPDETPEAMPDEPINKQFPNRKFYPGLNYLSTNQMVSDVSAGKYLIIDARPELGYNTLHIKESANIHSGDKQFVEKFLQLIEQNKKPIVFYCGGLTCLKSYKASTKAMQELNKRKIKRDVYTYDSGITAFAYASPDWVLKNGKPVSPENPILNVKKLKKHAKKAEDFVELIENDEENNYIILDVRERSQRILSKLFMFKKEHRITVLEPEKLIEFLNETKASDQLLMVYGAVEKQIESVFQLIQMTGVKKWFYLEGGEYAYSQFMIKTHVSN